MGEFQKKIQNYFMASPIDARPATPLTKSEKVETTDKTKQGSK